MPGGTEDPRRGCLEQLGAPRRYRGRVLRVRWDEEWPRHGYPVPGEGARRSWHHRQLRRARTTRTRISDDAFVRFLEIIDGIAARTALGRIGEPQDVGKAIAFLAWKGAGWITGQDIQVSGDTQCELITARVREPGSAFERASLNDRLRHT
jgi:hypothetical protein